jgi:hypothetical protein
LVCPIQELEATLAQSDEESFLKTLAAAREEKYSGWMLSSVLSDSKNAAQRRKPFPFEPADVLPWWKATEEFQSQGESAGQTNFE